MERILQVVPLADLIAERADDNSLWRRCGAMIRRFHAVGVVHADLNARNILVGPGQAVHLVDFDRARIAEGDAAAFRANLARLRRSLEKLWPDALRADLDDCWNQLLGGYGQAGEAA
jgi:3-deoxy-D-manno-octulosonic acid kinase